MKTNIQNFNLDILQYWLDKGFCKGQGDGIEGVCLEQAIALCAGLPLTDQPDSCVDPAVSEFGRNLNDGPWSTSQARSNGLKEFAYAQLGTADSFDSSKWQTRLAELTIRHILPIALRNVAKVCPKSAESLEAAAVECEVEGSKESAMKAQKAADAAYFAANVAHYAADAIYAAKYAALAGYAANAASRTAYYAYYAYKAYNAAKAAYNTYKAYNADAANYASRTAATDEDRDRILTLSAQLATQAINEQLNENH